MKLEVYKITNRINGKVYIGITNQGVSTRFRDHLKDARGNSNFPIHMALRKYGQNNFQIEVIEDLSDKDYDYLKEREVHWIEEFNSYKKGYNCTLGGDGTFGSFHSEETKDKIRQKAIGRRHSDEAKKRMSESHKKREWDHEELSKRAELANKIRWSSEDSHKKASENSPKRKVIIQYDLCMNYITEYISGNEAARSIGKTHQNIAACARGKLKTAYGFIWKYKEENNN